MKFISTLTLAAGVTLAALSASAETHTIYSEDYSTYELDTVFTNQSPWWAPNWNGGDIVQSSVSTDGPDGARAFTRATQVFAGRFYGGGIRGDIRAYDIPAGVSDDPADITLRLWMKGTSSQSRGPVGLSVISKDEAGANTGAVYYKLPIVPADWTEIAVSFADMQAGIPNVEEGDFDFSSPGLQVFIWMRTDYEDGWPFQEDEEHTYSVSIADVRIESVTTGEVPGGDIYEEDFSALPLDTVFTNQDPWWSPNWNGADPSQLIAATDGPGGLVAVTRTTTVNVGGFHGGGIRGPVVDYNARDGVAHEDINFSLWVKGSSSADRGGVGISVISKDDENANTGAVYYHLPVVPPEWAQVTLSFADMMAGVPNIEEGDFDFSSPRLQVFLWMRSDVEAAWPLEGDAEHTYSVSLAHIRITTDEIPNNMWNGFPIFDDWVDTGHWMGWLHVANAPWVYSWDLAKFIYMPGEGDGSGAWAFILNP